MRNHEDKLLLLERTCRLLHSFKLEASNQALHGKFNHFPIFVPLLPCTYFSHLGGSMLLSFSTAQPFHPSLPASITISFNLPSPLSGPLLKSSHMLRSVRAGGKPQVDPTPPLGLASVPCTQTHVATGHTKEGKEEGAGSCLSV